MTDQGQLIMCSERMPNKSAKYRIKNDTGCNNGEGSMYFDVEKGWDVPDMIKNFYKVVGWYENHAH